MRTRAITLVESRKAEHRQAARDLLTLLMPHTGKAQRIGITGVPGARNPPPSTRRAAT